MCHSQPARRKQFVAAGFFPKSGSFLSDQPETVRRFCLVARLKQWKRSANPKHRHPAIQSCQAACISLVDLRPCWFSNKQLVEELARLKSRLRAVRGHDATLANSERLALASGLLYSGPEEMVREEKINTAIHNCLAGVYGREAILARLEEFLDTIRAKGELREAELHAVETRVRHILCGIVDGAEADLRASKLAGE